jgi:hypothetical protein
LYHHCLFCNGHLGRNHVIEAFPVGRSLAFDALRGRLWVVCRRCARWNLTPLDERWEAVEECERAFSRYRAVAASGQVALCRLPNGVVLVRIGRPAAVELASWRYGEPLSRRRRRVLLGTGAATTVIAGAALTSALVAGLGGLVALSATVSYAQMLHAWRSNRPFRIYTADGEIEIGPRELRTVRLVPERSGGWRLDVPAPGTARDARPLPSQTTWLHYEGDEAIHTAGRMLPRMNPLGASAAAIRHALAFVRHDDASADSIFATAASTGRTWSRLMRGERSLGALPGPVKLALEMVAHASIEKQALAGEVRALELAWQEAERIAAIADSLVAPRITDRLKRMTEAQRRSENAEEGR